MDLETLKQLLAWNSSVHLGFLLLWGLALRYGHDWIFNLHKSWAFKNLTASQFDQVHYQGMNLYKIFILGFNLVPYLILQCLN